MKNTNKKVIGCLLAAFLGVTSAAALSTEEMENYINEKAAASQEEAKEQTEKAKEQAAVNAIPELPAEKLAELNEKLPKAAEAITQTQQCGIGSDMCSPEYLGKLLALRIVDTMHEDADRDLTASEKRAIYYSLNKLLFQPNDPSPRKYLKEIPTFTEYSKTYPSDKIDWEQFKTAAEKAQGLVYDAVVDIVTEYAKNNEKPFHYSAYWLYYATH